MISYLEFEKPVAELEKRIAELEESVVHMSSLCGRFELERKQDKERINELQHRCDQLTRQQLEVGGGEETAKPVTVVGSSPRDRIEFWLALRGKEIASR